ncbi:unnamed protein product [Rodentolepis nana]|uniref:AMP_N domain-containing protein n=1 Tax=Rodentolepis nana TaxID=102285 RepID=A0A158QIC6_RODNA|nr:unnamed protein product [Rodentolepis nana]
MDEDIEAEFRRLHQRLREKYQIDQISIWGIQQPLIRALIGKSENYGVTGIGSFQQTFELNRTEYAWKATVPNGEVMALCPGKRPVQFYVVSNCTGFPQLPASQVVSHDSFFVFTNCTGGFRSLIFKQDLNEETRDVNAKTDQADFPWNDFSALSCSFTRA